MMQDITELAGSSPDVVFDRHVLARRLRLADFDAAHAALRLARLADAVLAVVPDRDAARAGDVLEPLARHDGRRLLLPLRADPRDRFLRRLLGQPRILLLGV